MIEQVEAIGFVQASRPHAEDDFSIEKKIFHSDGTSRACTSGMVKKLKVVSRNMQTARCSVSKP